MGERVVAEAVGKRGKLAGIDTRSACVVNTPLNVISLARVPLEELRVRVDDHRVTVHARAGSDAVLVGGVPVRGGGSEV